jgi:hypothetical protein
MKNLKKYKKVELQKLQYKIHAFINNKMFYRFSSPDPNLIGFCTEYYFPAEKFSKNNFYNYSHLVNATNLKLYKKYPHILKKDYKQWLKSLYKAIKNEKLTKKLQ